MLLLFGVSAQSGVAAARVPAPDWLSHGSAYLVLAALACRALTGGFRRPVGGRELLLAVALATLYGVSDEYHQSFVPGRDASPGDVLKDLSGALVGATLCRALTAPNRRASEARR
jgi:VanZ family protein